MASFDLAHTLPSMPSTSLSPPPTASNGTKRELNGSASPLTELTSEAPKKRYNLTPTEQQALRLQKLLSNPDREIKIPLPAKGKELRAPRETIKNVSGSSAGAGSGEFHVYKHSRRREYERIKMMQDKAQKDKEREEYEERQRILQQESSAKTNKNRAKREKKKGAKMAAKGGVVKKEGSDAKDEGRSQGNGDVNEEQGDGMAKRKRINAEGTAQIVFRRKDDDDDPED